MNPGPLTLLGNDYAEDLLREMKLNKATLPAGATVAHLAAQIEASFRSRLQLIKQQGAYR